MQKDERTPLEEYKARRQLLHNCEYQIALLDAQRERLANECKLMKAKLAVKDKIVLENADILKEATKDATKS